MSVTPGMTYTVVKVGGKGIGGISHAMPSQRQACLRTGSCYVTVTDVDAVAKTRSNLGERSDGTTGISPPSVASA